MAVMKEVKGQAFLRHARQEAVIVRGIFTIGTGTTCVTASDVDTPDLTLTRTGVGLYTLAYPGSPDDVMPKFTIINGGGGTPNISFVKVLTNNPIFTSTAGQATLSLTAAGAPFTAADNTETTFQIYVELTGDTGV